MATLRPAIDLIIPARNEQLTIPRLLAVLPRSVFRHVVVVDNGSVDRTAELARRGGAAVVHEPKRGYGAACWAGLAWIRQQGERDCPLAVAFLDADLADDPAELPRLCLPILTDQADLVLGSRVARAEPGALDLHQRLGNWLACGLIRLTSGRKYTDLGPMRAIRWSSLDQISMRDRTWGWTVEMQFKAARSGLRVTELDVPYRRRYAGKSQISGSLIGSLRAAIKIIITIMKLWWVSRRDRNSNSGRRARAD